MPEDKWQAPCHRNWGSAAARSAQAIIAGWAHVAMGHSRVSVVTDTFPFPGSIPASGKSLGSHELGHSNGSTAATATSATSAFLPAVQRFHAPAASATSAAAEAPPPPPPPREFPAAAAAAPVATPSVLYHPDVFPHAAASSEAPLLRRSLPPPPPRPSRRHICCCSRRHNRRLLLRRRRGVPRSAVVRTFLHAYRIKLHDAGQDEGDWAETMVKTLAHFTGCVVLAVRGSDLVLAHAWIRVHLEHKGSPLVSDVGFQSRDFRGCPRPSMEECRVFAQAFARICLPWYVNV
jgi:hypothetical protein